ncbi:MAG: lipid IV(A) 3-deoxy-D-manno-octulosonic acid transferase [Sulfurimonas sp.]|nr:lipid IV(A) 3-deoxy-D-manno-octulosonic acid transferase [Sulfurimonas sp.]MDQ7061189.1 lipid IV(A) 3-deoxy-D-manno-octulosonic acid transferase [Sulfurimonas sp.]
MPFSIFYYTLSVLLYLLALPLLVYLSFKKKYKESIPSRFFLFKNPKFSYENGIWFHVCSFGEAKALAPILNDLKDKDVKITTVTQTGQNQVKKYAVETRYLPYEMFLPFWTKKQKVLVVLEAEFWYMLFATMFSKGTRIILLNARISEKSAKKYLQMAWFYKRILNKVEIIYAQSEADKNRFLALGATNIEVIGNIKLAGEIKQTKEYEKPKCEVIVAGSTHEGEEKAILEAFALYKRNAKLIIVPRHPERFDDVYALMHAYAKENDLSVSRISKTSSFEADLILVDAMGELNNMYAISDIAIVGGAFIEGIGGHNPLEPAHFGCKIITGKYFHDQKELYKYVHHVQYVESDEILGALTESKELPPSMVEETINLQTVINKIKQG